MPFEIIPSSQPQVPILVSVPHCGTKIPDDIRDRYAPEMIKQIDDTDFYVDRLYDFVGEMGIGMIRAKYSRWVIDLNRSADSQPLYSDGRVITALCPTTDFNGKNIYQESGPDTHEVDRRIDAYYQPYYQQIRQELSELQIKFDHVLFFDAHSIRQYVPGIRKEKFPDLILGDVDGQAAHPQLIETTAHVLANTDYRFQHNHPFKGGNLTRTFGRPKNNIHAIQLEMSKLVYMDDKETAYHEDRANKIRTVLENMFTALLSTLDQLNRK